jgi:hypothetical protein
MRTFSRDIQTLIAVSLPEIILIGILVPVLLIFIDIEKKKYFVSKIFNKIKKSKIEIIIIWITTFYIFYILRDITVITRYAIMFAPFLILVVLFFFEAIVNHLQKVIKQSLFATYVLVIILSSVLISFKTIKPSVDDFVNGFQSTYKDIAMIINAYSKNQKVSVGVADVGIIGAYSNARVYDSVGLVDNERFNYHSTLDYYIDKKPDFIILREEEIEKVIPIGTGYEILFRKRLPGFGINEPEPRTVTLFKISWK